MQRMLRLTKKTPLNGIEKIKSAENNRPLIATTLFFKNGFVSFSHCRLEVNG